MNLSTNGPNTVELSCSPAMEKKFKEFFEIEMLQGDRWETDGMICYRIEVSTQKMQQLKQWFIETFPIQHEEN